MNNLKNNFLNFIRKLKRFLKEIQILCTGIRNPKIYGQLGEDAVIRNHIEWLGLDINEKGAYLDIGCNHPWIGSNTFKFYKMVECGYAIDIGIEKELSWKKFRPNDFFINTAIVPNDYPDEFATFYLGSQYGEPTAHIDKYGINVEKKSKFKIKVKVTKAKDICSTVCSNPKWHKAKWRILDIDVEGLDFEILKSLNLESLKPDIISIESFPPSELNFQLKLNYHLKDNLVVRHLQNYGYSLQSICGPTLIFVRNNSKIKF